MELTEFWEKEKERAEIIKRMKTTTEYIEWLVGFLKTNTSLYDDEVSYADETLEKEDVDRAGQLSIFFSIIDLYCTNNLIGKNEKADHVCSYNVKYNDNYFCIGVYVGQGAYIFAEIINEAPSIYVCFENIMQDIQDKNYEAKQSKLKELYKIACELKELGTSMSVVENKIYKAFYSKG